MPVFPLCSFLRALQHGQTLVPQPEEFFLVFLRECCNLMPSLLSLLLNMLAGEWKLVFLEKGKLCWTSAEVHR